MKSLHQDGDHAPCSDEKRDEASSEALTLHGVIERVTFHNTENGFTVARVGIADKARPITVVGSMIDPVPGQTLVMQGRWKEDPKWGLQFAADVCYREFLPSVEGIRQFLQSGMVKGVGKKMAARIVETFGDETIHILDNDPDRLAQVKGLRHKQLESIKTAWREHCELRDLMLFLQSHGISGSYAVRLFKHYGPIALQVIQENPYQVALDVHGIGFLTADAIAAKLGFPSDSELRVEAGIIYVLQQTIGNGHVYFPRPGLLERSVETLGVDQEAVAQGLARLAARRRVAIERLDDEQDDAVYLMPYCISERGVARRMLALASAPRVVRPIEADKAIAWVQDRLKLQLAPKQAEAVRLAALHKTLVVTGGPGTGKTTIINAILQVFAAISARVLLAAPTGRAAKRMAEATEHEAKTIHRLLEFSPLTGSFLRNEDNPLACDLLIVDEASMIDVVLMHHLLKAVPPGSGLVLVGDVNQLPSVGPGNVLKDIIASQTTSVVELNEIFRQARESAIVVNAHAINQGRMPELETPSDELSDFYFIRRENPEQAVELVVDLVKNHIPRRFHLDPVNEIQVLTPMHKGLAGANNLNLQLQQALNPQPTAVTRADRSFRLHDKVMQIRNNYDKEIFNGDIGRILAVDAEDKKVVVDFDGRDVVLDYVDLDDLVPAYAVSIHKSQGSEYPAVVIPLLTQHFIMLQRNLIYTAITRGKRLVVLVGSPKAMRIAVNNNDPHKRYTFLAQRLRQGIDNAAVLELQPVPETSELP